MNDRILRIASALMRAANVLNWLAVGAFAIALVMSFPFAETLLRHLAAKYQSMDMVPVLWTMRLLGLIAIVAGPVLHVIFTRLAAIVDTARAGDPFVGVNADRLLAIGWAMLALQLLDVVLGVMAVWLDMLHVDRAGWTPSLGGWIATLMIFVLARVFATGTRMRDELEMTV